MIKVTSIKAVIQPVNLVAKIVPAATNILVFAEAVIKILK